MTGRLVGCPEKEGMMRRTAEAVVVVRCGAPAPSALACGHRREGEISVRARVLLRTGLTATMVPLV